MDKQSDQEKSPPSNASSRACAIFAREALFPTSIDWNGKHRAIHPALQALDLLRDDAIKSEKVPYSKLFPRHVIVVPSPGGGMQWNGKPDIVDASMEVIPNKLAVKCIQCGTYRDGVKAFTERREDTTKHIFHEIVLCSDRLLKNDYDKATDLTLLGQRGNLPKRSLAAVEESLAHEITKIRLESTSTVNQDGNLSTCEKMAIVEVSAARLAECLYQKQGTEVYRGSALGHIGFSLLPPTLQESFRKKCVRELATNATKREFGNEGAQCVDAAFHWLDL